MCRFHEQSKPKRKERTDAKFSEMMLIIILFFSSEEKEKFEKILWYSYIINHGKYYITDTVFSIENMLFDVAFCIPSKGKSFFFLKKR